MDQDLQNIPWDTVVQRIQILNKNLDAVNITNMIMKRENFIIALFNKNVLDLNIGGRDVFSKVVEWNLGIALFDPLFNFEKRKVMGESRLEFLEGLRKRCLVVGLLNLLLSPVLFCFLGLYLFYRYAEVKKTPMLIVINDD